MKKLKNLSIQTVGRIMRMPEWRHYETDDLNRAYVFTNLSDVDIAEDIAKDYITVYESQRNQKNYDLIDLESIHIKRKHEKTRLSGEISKIFQKIAKKGNLTKKITLKPTQLLNEILVDGKIVKLDKIQTVEHAGTIEIKISDKELQYRFDLYARSMSTPFAPVHSSGRLKTALYKFFESVMNIKDEFEIQKIILAEENHQFVSDVINESKEEYRKTIVEEETKKEINTSIWNVPETIPYTKVHNEKNYSKSIMNPVYFTKGFKTEITFMDFLDEPNNSVKWWFKNGESDKKYFAISYEDDEGTIRAFYVDFIIKMKDGRIGLFDTKSGITAKVAKEKAESLSKYIKKHSSSKKKFFGGIALNKDGSWRYNDKSNYVFNEDDLSNWEFLNLK
jgi:type III restriction enzyme